MIIPNLICVFVGLNPGVRTATTGHAYAHPTNRFWYASDSYSSRHELLTRTIRKLLHSSGCTTRLCRPEEDVDLPRLFELGNTNIVSRPTANGSELKKSEMDESYPVLEEKIKRYKPEAVCIVGKSIWESIWRATHHGKNMGKHQFKDGWQDEELNLGRIDGEGWKGARVFVAPSTSGLAGSVKPAEKERIFAILGLWVAQRRVERAAAAAT